ncbi:MAG: hypothetical protein ACRDRH_27940, partial [Pseudonocardia sp.]
MFTRVAARLPPEAAARIIALIADTITDAEDGELGDRSLLSLIKTDPGSVSLESMLTEIDKLPAVRAIALPPGLFVVGRTATDSTEDPGTIGTGAAAPSRAARALSG